jgi:hypothetical protein
MAPVTALRDIGARLDEYPRGDGYEVGPTIFARWPWTPDSAAEVLNEDPINGTAPSAPDMRYAIEVSIALVVVQVWSSWRAGAVPTVEEAVEAVLYYATHDAYLPGG